MYEYKFLKIDVGTLTMKIKGDYQQIVHDHAKDGWRLVQIFSPSTGIAGTSAYIELIFEKSVS